MNIQPETVAVVTGAGSGIGRALAQGLARRGCALALADINADGLEETVALVRSSARAVTSHQLDVADRTAVEQFAAAVAQEHGKVNLLINNAGVALGGTIEEVSIENMAWLLNINFWGTVYGVKAFLPVLKQQPTAHIVNLSSSFGLVAGFGHAAYSASKFAVRGFSEALRLELAATTVRVSCVHPGPIKTNIARSARVDGLSEERREQTRSFERVLHISPEQAATVIVRGVEANRARILIGQDAYLMDMLQRLAPVRAPAIIQKIIAKKQAG